MFIELAGGETELRRSEMCQMSLLRSSVRYRATHSINIPRLWRSGIREFANSIHSAKGTRTTRARRLPQADCGRRALQSSYFAP